jgi:hypothetical protein
MVPGWLYLLLLLRSFPCRHWQLDQAGSRRIVGWPRLLLVTAAGLRGRLLLQGCVR